MLAICDPRVTRHASPHKRWRQRLTPSVAGVELVPELDLGLAEAPTEQDAPTVHLAREIDEPKAAILEINAQLLELMLKSVDLTREHLCLALQLLGALARLSGACCRRHEIELEDFLAPEAVLSHHVFHDLANERKGSIRAFDGEQHHVAEVSVWTPYSRD